METKKFSAMLANASMEDLQVIYYKFQEQLMFNSKTLESLQSGIKEMEVCKRYVREACDLKDGDSGYFNLCDDVASAIHYKDNGKFLVDLGTGYFVEKTADSVTSHLKRKIELFTRKSNEVKAQLYELQTSIEIVKNKLTKSSTQNQTN
eukprot:GAHX01000931.1.p1 GENE.GAHX01000931.1~~GAHX01000931.1.p1  ORF type:complete len:161 (-),score=33.73 GAHX01000931.1:30-476(-)